MNNAPPFSKLESLNHDIRLAILGAFESFDDLAALIRASPTFFHTFLGYKAPLLLSVVRNILGPATRDAALLTKTWLDDIDHRFGNKFQVDEVVHDYKAYLRVAGPPWVTGLDFKSVAALTHITRLTQFCVDVFGYFQCQRFMHELDPVEGDVTLSRLPTLSRNERIRIAQAILRRQVLETICHDRIGEPHEWNRAMETLLPLFRTWEWQQILDIDDFMLSLLKQLTTWRYNGDKWKKLHSPGLDLEPTVQKLKKAADDTRLWSYRNGARESMFGGFLEFLAGSFRIAILVLSGAYHSTTLRDDGNPSLEFDTDDQPWAWRDALRGKETRRWGHGLVKKPPPGIADEQYQEVIGALKSWKSYGMVFWDRDRAERLKQTSELGMCQTGWLTPWQD